MSQSHINEGKIKRPKQEQDLTPEEQLEWLICAEDIEYWLQKYAYVSTDAGKELFRPRTYQLRLIDAICVKEDRFTVGCIPRQAGKTVSVGLIKLHTAIFNNGKHVGITSYKLANCKDYIDRIKFTYEHLPFWMKPVVLEYNKFGIKFAHSSFISQVITETSLRGTTTTDIIVDELAFCSEKIAAEFWASLLPSISAKGEMAQTKITVISTPSGSSGTFAQLWFNAKNGSNGFIPIGADYDEIPGRTEDFAKSMIRKFGKNKFDQEFKCVHSSTMLSISHNDTQQQTTIGTLFDTYATLTQDKGDTHVNSLDLKVLDGTTLRAFDGVVRSWHDSHLMVTFNDNTHLRCSHNHDIRLKQEWKAACDLRVGDETDTGLSVTKVEVMNDPCYLYDLINVHDTHSYTTNGVTSHNCVFISTKGTLVSSPVIEALPFKEPVRRVGDLSIYVDSLHGRKLGMACDVSDGIEQDSHAFQIVDLDTFEQCAEFKNNNLNQTMYTKVIIKTVKFLFEEGAAEVYYTIENNGLSAGVIRLLENYSDPVFDRAMLISDEGGKRLGMWTSNKSKLKGCMQLKDMIESNILKINSEGFIDELRFFVKAGSSYKAESGTHDDLVMAMVLLMNMLTVLMNYEDKVYDTMSEIDITNNNDEVWGIAF